MDKPPSNSARFGLLLVELERTTLAEIRRAAGTGILSHKGDAGESIYWLCYTRKVVPARLWVVSHGEMGGPAHAVTEVIVKRVNSPAQTSDCPSLPSGMRPVSFDMPVWLGSTEVGLGPLGKPSHQSGSWRSYDYESKVPGKCDGGFDRLNSLMLHSVRGTVESIYLSQATSC